MGQLDFSLRACLASLFISSHLWYLVVIDFFFSLHLFLCGHVFVLALMGCWCYHMIFHLASSLWLAWLQSLSNSCSLLTTRFFILFFPPGFPFYPFTLVFLFYFICLFIFEIKLLKTQLANERNEGDLGWIWVLRTDLLVMPLLWNFPEDIMRAEEDDCFMERWRHYSEKKCSLQTDWKIDTCVLAVCVLSWVVKLTDWTAKLQGKF